MTVKVLTYNYTGAVQSFVVPANVTSLRLELWGAGGGNAQGYGTTTGFTDTAAGTSSSTSPLGQAVLGNGAGYVAGTMSVTPGQVLSIYVGGNGYSSDTDQMSGTDGVTYTRRGGPGGYNGGGAGGNGVYKQGNNFGESQEASGGAGGGGATDIRVGGTALANRILVAGGSGGMGGGLHNAWLSALWGPNQTQTITGNPSTPQPPYFPVTYYASGNGRNGWGGGTTGGAGGLASSYSGGTTLNTGGGGGTQSAGGAGGASVQGITGSAGAVGVGGHGAIGTVTSSGVSADQGGGGGGGGYYGGGGGGLGYDSFGTGQYSGFGGGGGGGSNYVDSSLVSPVNVAHAYPPASAGASGNGGFARITYTQPPNAPTINSPSTGSVVSFDRAVTVSYSFSSVDPSAFATAIDVQWKKSTDSTWNLQHAISGNDGTYTFPPNFFSPGFTYNIQVRTFDNENTPSAWSQIDLIVITPPATPVITAPAVDASVGGSSFVVTWTNPSGSPELTYRVLISKRDGTAILYDSGDVVTNTRVNLVPTPSFEFGIGSWLVVGGSIATSTTWKYYGANSGKVTWAASSAAYVYIPIATQVGKTYNVAARVTLGTVATDPQMTLSAANPNAATTPFATGPTSAVAVAGTFEKLELSFVAQQSTTWIVLTPGTGVVTAGKVNYIDAVIAELNPGAGRPFFDGSNPQGLAGTASWTGTAGNSPSKLINADVLSHTVAWSGASEPVTAQVSYSNVASNGAYSNPASRNFTINVAPPGTPTVVLTPSNDTGSVTFDITVNDSPAPTAFVDIFRTDVTHGEPEIRIATNLVPDPTTHKVIYVDRSLATNTTYTYRVRAYSASLGYAEVT